MKIINRLFLCVILLSVMVSCMDDESFGTAIPIQEAVNYLPLTVGNQWSYRNVVDIPNQYHQESQETLKTSASTNENETTSYLFTSNASSKKQGIYSVLLTNGKANKVNGKVIYNGDFVFHLPILGDSISIPLHNLLLLNQNAEAGDVLSEVSGEFMDTIQFSNTSLPVIYQYTLKTVEAGVYETYSNGQTTFNDVISSKFILNLSATADLPVNFDLELMLDQDVLRVTNYFAKNVGMISSQTDIHVEFEDLSEFSVPQISPIIGTASQTLTHYNIEGDTLL